jgi:hypothetical protein
MDDKRGKDDVRGKDDKRGQDDVRGKDDKRGKDDVRGKKDVRGKTDVRGKIIVKGLRVSGKINEVIGDSNENGNAKRRKITTKEQSSFRSQSQSHSPSRSHSRSLSNIPLQFFRYFFSLLQNHFLSLMQSGVCDHWMKSVEVRIFSSTLSFHFTYFHSFKYFFTSI